MKLARYWAKEKVEVLAPDGKRHQITCRGWSDDGASAASTHARRRAENIGSRLTSLILEDRKSYLYGDNPLPEPVIEEVDDKNGVRQAAVTRNAYGSLVLNAERMMFVDIDLPPKREKGMLSRLFGSHSAADVPNLSPEETAALTNAEQVCKNRGGLALRAYRTKGGLRLIIVSNEFDPKSTQSDSILEEFRSDPLYRKLCMRQESYRARLTPKPWRVDLLSKPPAFPFATEAEKTRFKNWEHDYATKTEAYATCEFLKTIGSNTPRPEFSALIQLHDSKTRSSSGLCLA